MHITVLMYIFVTPFGIQKRSRHIQIFISADDVAWPQATDEQHHPFAFQPGPVFGDEGIHAKVHQSFWDKLHDETTAAFAEGKYYEGLKNAVTETGLELKKYFPVSGENYNELPNEITFS